MKKQVLTISVIIIISTLLWVFVSFDEEYSISLNLPIEITNIPDSLSVSYLSEQELNLSLKGKGWILAKYTIGSEPKFNIPCPLEIGQNEISVKNTINVNSWLSSSIQVNEINPDKITLKVEKTISKKVKIIPILGITYKNGYGLISDITVKPDSTIIFGPKSVVDQIEFINTESKILKDIEESTNISLLINKSKFIQSNISECIISLEVEKIVDKSFEKLPVVIRGIPPRYELLISPQNVDVILRGGIGKLSKLKNDDLTVFVNFAQALNDTSGAIEPQVEIPEYSTLVDIKPNRLEYIIKKY